MNLVFATEWKTAIKNMSSLPGNLWKIPGIPHTGWILEYVYDLREDGGSLSMDCA